MGHRRSSGTSPEGSFFLNIGAAPADPFLPHQVVLELSDLFCLQNTLHWIKSITVETIDGDTVSAGHFKPINSKRFVNDCHEYVFHLTHEGDVPVDRRGVGVPYVHKSNIGRWKHTEGHDKRCRGNTWFVPYKTIVSRDKDRPHPATFPVQLAEYCLRLHGKNPQDTTLLDPLRRHRPLRRGRAATRSRPLRRIRHRRRLSSDGV